MAGKWKEVKFIGNLDARAVNADWIKLLSRDVDVNGEEIPTRFDEEAAERGETFTPIRDRDGEED